MRAAARAAVLCLVAGILSTVAPSDAAPAHPNPRGAPVVHKVRPAHGSTKGGDKVVVKGADLAGATAVLFGTKKGKHLKVKSAHKLTVVTPKHAAGRVDVRVVTERGTSAKSKVDRFTYAVPPAVTSVSPATGGTTGGARVTVAGTGLTKASVVTFGGVPGTAVTVASARSLSVTAPAHVAGVVDVRVTGPGGQSAVVAPDHFTFLPSGPVVTAPVPADADADPQVFFEDVDCAGPGSCAAVGSYRRGLMNNRPLVDQLGGGGWTATSAPLPPDAVPSQLGDSLHSVSCPTTTFCAAVGGYARTDGNLGPLVDVWSGGRWSAASIALPVGSNYADFSAVSCASPTWCVAVGTTFITGVKQPFVAAYNGVVWATDLPGGTGGATSGSLSAVDCSAVHACGVAGEETDAGGAKRGLAGRLTGGGGLTWDPVEVAPSDVAPAGFVALLAVSCPDVAAHYGCTATGYYSPTSNGHKAVVTHFGGDGVGLTLGTYGPATTDDTRGERIACWSPAHCLVSGYYDTAITGPRFALALTTTDVSITAHTGPSPSDPGTAQSSELGVACTSSAACLAAGTYAATVGTDHGMVVQSAGVNLTSVPIGVPAGATYSTLTDVAFESDTSGVAIGTYRTADNKTQGLLLIGLTVPPAPG